MKRLEVVTQLMCSVLHQSWFDNAPHYNGLDPELVNLLNGVEILADEIISRNTALIRREYEAMPKCATCQLPEQMHYVLNRYSCSTFRQPKEKS